MDVDTALPRAGGTAGVAIWLEAGVLDEPGRLVGCSLVMFCLYKHRQTVLENDFLMLTRFLQVLPAFSHAGQVKTFEVLEDLIFHVC